LTHRGARLPSSSHFGLRFPRLTPSRSSNSPRRRAGISATLLAAALRAQSAGVLIAERRAGSSTLRIVFANDSFCAMTGHAGAELVGRDYEVLHIDRAEIERVREWLPRAKPGDPLVGEGFLARADGASVAVAWSFDPLCNQRGRVTHIVATYRDQTEKRRLQEALVHSQRLDAVGRLAGGVAHDFNNLLSVINGYCEILAAHVGANPQAMREVAEIHNAGRKAAALTQQLLAFSRRKPLDARVINLNELIQENVDILRRLIGDAGRLDLDLSDELANVRTDAAQFQQVLLNLVLNARDALRDKGRIIVKTANRTITGVQHRRTTDVAPGRYVALTVSDNGTGMDAETMKHLFEPFFTTKPEGKGTGLGLALVYGVVQQSGGTINVSSELLVGSRFEVLLPAVDAAIEQPPPPVAPLPSLRGNETVWLVEPDEVVRKMVAGMLTADGYRVTAVATCAETPTDGETLHSVQLLIATLRGEGEKLARRILEQRPDLRVLAIGDHEGEEEAVSWLAPERQSGLIKPYALSALLRAARKLLDT
jgi:two-component system, cell cycle sensor histidine kinase and response regulator CckA